MVINHPDTEQNPKAYAYLGDVYLYFFENSDSSLSIANNHFEDSAFQAYKKSVQFNIQQKGYRNLDLNDSADIARLHFFMDSVFRLTDANIKNSDALVGVYYSGFRALADAITRKGSSAFLAGHDAQALYYYEKARRILGFLSATNELRLNDMALYYASLSAHAVRDWDKAVKYGKILKKIEFGDSILQQVPVHLNLMVALRQKGDSAQFMKETEVFELKFPDHLAAMYREKAMFFVMHENYKLALSAIDQAIMHESDNPDYLVDKGLIYESMDKKTRALNVYQQALELDSLNFDALFSIGAMHFNASSDTMQTREGFTISRDDDPDVYWQRRGKAKQCLKKARPYFEKAMDVNPDDKDVLMALRVVYSVLEEKEKYRDINQILNSTSNE
jgi:tetratricopeptide (TPR) repeat protein